MTTTVVLGGTVVVTASFVDVLGSAAIVNAVSWSTNPPDDPTIAGGFVDLTPDPPPAMTASVFGVAVGTVKLIASPDTNDSIQATIDFTVTGSSGTPVSGTIT